MDSSVLYRFDLVPFLHQDVSRADAAKRCWDTTHLLAALQGLVNRTAPQLYLRAILPADDFWWDWLHSPGQWLEGCTTVDLESLEDVLAQFDSYYQGAVIYDPKVPATSNLASTIAGVENLLPVRYDTSPGSSYSQWVASGRLDAVRWLLDPGGESRFHADANGEYSTGSTKANAYLWAKQEYLDSGRCDPRKLAYYLDAYWLHVPTVAAPQNHTLTNHDYFISHRAFFFDLGPWDDESPVDDPEQPVGTDARTLRAILHSAYEQTGGQEMIHSGGFTPWAYKYTNHGIAGGHHEPVPTEWHYAQTLSAYNVYMDADALGLGAMANASFYQHYPLEQRNPQNPKPSPEKLAERGLIDGEKQVKPRRYVTFYIGDYDSAAWLYSQIPSIWSDPKRGEMPLGWAFNPNLADRAPMAMAYTRQTRTERDFFVAGDSGAGYVNPGMLEEPREFSGMPSGLEVWREHCQRYYAQWDLSITGFIIDGYGPGLTEDGMRVYTDFSKDGIVAQKIGQQGLFEDMPFIRMNLDLDGRPEDVAETIASRLEGGMPQFQIFRTILKTPSWHVAVRDHLRRLQPAAEIVDPYTFFALLRQHLSATHAPQGTDL